MSKIIMKRRGRNIFINGEKVSIPSKTKVPFGTVVLKYHNCEERDCNIICGSLLAEEGEGYFFGIYCDDDYILTRETCERLSTKHIRYHPIRNMIEELKIPQIVLFERGSSTEIVEERRYDNRHCLNGRRTNHWYTDGKRGFRSMKDHPNGGWVETLSIKGWTYMFNVEFANPRRRGSETYIDTVVVTPQCDPTLLKGELARY